MNNNLFARASSASLVHIALNGSVGNKKISIDETLTLAELGVQLAANGGEPEYPGAEIAKLNLCGLAPAEVMRKTRELTTAWENAKRAFAQQGGASLGDRIIAKVLEYLRNAHGLAEGANTWTIKAGNLALYPYESNGLVQFTVQGSPQWGSN